MSSNLESQNTAQDNSPVSRQLNQSRDSEESEKLNPNRLDDEKYRKKVNFDDFDTVQIQEKDAIFKMEQATDHNMFTGLGEESMRT